MPKTVAEMLATVEELKADEFGTEVLAPALARAIRMAADEGLAGVLAAIDEELDA